jgi:transposase
MPYSLDLRQRVINFVENGGTITKAAHKFWIGIASIYRWLSRPKLSATKVKNRQRKLDWKKLEKDVKQMNLKTNILGIYCIMADIFQIVC